MLSVSSMASPRFSFVPARWLAPDAPLNASARLVLCVLCQWVNSRSGECWPSITTIAEHAKLSLNTVRQAVRDLEKAGALIVRRGRTDAKGDPTSHLYTIVGYDPPVAEENASGHRRLRGPAADGKEARIRRMAATLLQAREGGSIQIPPPLQSDTGGGIQDAPGVLQSSTPNVVKNDRNEHGASLSLTRDNSEPQRQLPKPDWRDEIVAESYRRAVAAGRSRRQ